MKKHQVIFAPSVQYFKRQLTGNLVRERLGARVKGKNVWGQFEYLYSDGLRTTSSLESWHKKFNAAVNKKSPPFENLFRCLQTEQARVEKLLYKESLEISIVKINKNSQEKFKNYRY